RAMTRTHAYPLPLVKPLRATLGLLCFTALLPRAYAQELAKHAPPDTAVFIEIDNLAETRARHANDPLTQALRAKLTGQVEPEAWKQLQQQLGMTGDEILDRYFGKAAALIAVPWKN